MAALTPVPKIQFFDANGQPLVGGKLYSYAAGTVTPQVTYVDQGQTATNTNPVILDSRGEASVWLGTLPYKLKLTSATDVEIWTVDDIENDSNVTLATLAASNGSSLVGFIQSGTGAAARTVQSKLRDIVSVTDFGAVGDGVTDDTAAIQAAIDYVYSINGGTVLFPAGAFKVTSTINAKSYVNLQGAYGEDDTFGVQGPPKIGTELRWAGANTTVPILRVFNVRLFQLDGMHFDGDNKNVTAILVDSDNNPSGSQNEFHRFSVRKCLTGVQWGTSGIAGGAYANDGIRFSTFTIWSQMVGSKGFVINSGNAGQMSTIESGGIQVEDIGIDIVVANLVQIRRVFGGGVMDTAFIRSSIGIDILIEGCSSEAWGSGRTWRTNRPKFLKVVAPVETYPIIEATITLQQNQINNPIEVGYPVRIISVGDAWGYCKDYTTGVDEPAKGNFTAATSRCIAINNGVNPASINLTTNEPAMGWIDSANVDLTNLDPGRGWVAPAYDAANFSASGSMTWTVQNTDVATYAYTLANRTMTLSFTLDGTSVGGTLAAVLRVKIPNGKVATKAMSNTVRLLDNGTPAAAWCYTSAGGTWVDIQREDFANFAASTNATTVQGQITFEVN